MDRRSFLKFLGMAPAVLSVPKKSYSFLGGTFRPNPSPDIIPAIRLHFIQLKLAAGSRVTVREADGSLGTLTASNYWGHGDGSSTLDNAYINPGATLTVTRKDADMSNGITIDGSLHMLGSITLTKAAMPFSLQA
jgi:hypothetical protein